MRRCGCSLPSHHSLNPNHLPFDPGPGPPPGPCCPGPGPELPALLLLLLDPPPSPQLLALVGLRGEAGAAGGGAVGCCWGGEDVL